MISFADIERLGIDLPHSAVVDVKCVLGFCHVTVNGDRGLFRRLVARINEVTGQYEEFFIHKVSKAERRALCHALHKAGLTPSEIERMLSLGRNTAAHQICQHNLFLQEVKNLATDHMVCGNNHPKQSGQNK